MAMVKMTTIIETLSHPIMERKRNKKLKKCLTVFLQLHLLESAEVVDYEALEDLISEEVVSIIM